MAYTIAALETELPSPEMNDLVTEIIASTLRSLGLFSGGIHKIADLSLDKPPAPYYERWLSSTILYLQQQNVLSGDMTFNHDVRTLADLWNQWEAQHPVWATSPKLQAQIALLESCLRALPEVLSGKQFATDVMFRDSPVQLVAGDYYSEVIGETLIACIENQLRADANRTIRIVEIGAGTGGTTTKLIPLLQRFPIEEYCYTDVSEAFLMHAEKHKRHFPVLTTAVFDVSKPVASQSIAAAHYDVAIAADVFHATPNIRETLRNAKAVLKNQGVLLINEISTWSLFSHLTFGLLEGWWAHEDNSLRLPGSPGLQPEKWRAILAEEGFESILFPAEEAHQFGRQIVVARSNGWVRQRIAQQIPPQRPRTELKSVGLAEATNVRKETPSLRSPESMDQMRTDFIQRIIVEKLSEASKMDVAMIRKDAPFADFGVDSIIGVDLVRTINEALKIELEPIKLFEHSTINQLTQYISTSRQITAQLDHVQPASQKPDYPEYTDATPVAVDAGVNHRFVEDELLGDERETSSDVIGVEPIAIIGMSGRFAESENLDEFWRNLKEGKELIKTVSRWSTRDCVISESAGHSYCSSGSFVDSIDRFDPAFFGISAQEATCMDPQQRLFLEEAWKALEDAGYAGKGVHEKQCGVYVGCGSSNYDSLFVEEPPPQAFWGNSEAVIPARIAYYLDLQGPAIAVDTACSSSLVTIHLACQALWSRETEMALAGGVFLQATPELYQVANRAGMLSADGKCYSFDARANGWVPGEGVGVVVLKRLRDALQDGDYIHGVIAGSGINQDGRSNGLTAPNGRAQERLERSVYDRFKINPETIQVVEAHGTATVLGDSVEFGAISRAFREYTDKKQFCALGSIKTNIGHAATAAGVAGFLKLLLSLKHRQIPPSLNFQKGNPAIDLESGPFYVNTELKEWSVEDNRTRRAAISSFGFSGTNAHLVVEEAPPIEPTTVESPGYLLVLSARTPEQLKQLAQNLLALVRETPGLSMNDLSFSLFVGRMHLSHRLSCLTRDQKELIRLLEEWVERGAASQIYTSEIQEGRIREQVSLKKFGNYCIQECRSATNAAAYLDHLATIADLYIQGYSLDFTELFPRDSRRIPLPTYPFARERYWIDTARAARPRTMAAAAGGTRAALPHVAHSKTSSLSPQSYKPARGGAGENLLGWLQSGLSQMVMDILKVDAGAVAPDKILLDLGFDSIGLTTFANTINDKYQLDITPVLFFDYPSISEIAKYLSHERKSEVRRFYRASTVSNDDAAPLPATQPAAQESVVLPSGQVFSSELRFVNEPIAIVGVSAVMPQSDDLDEFWENLKNSKDMVTVIPPDRWSWEDYYGDPLKEVNKSNSRWGAFMREIDKFDPLFFGISPREAQIMDPQQRIFLEHVWKAIEDSGQKVSDLSGTRTGLFVGVGTNDYIDVLRDHHVALDGYTASGNTHSVLANRVSFLLNLRGPSAPIDTACSSSLVALHRAIESIHTGSCDMAIVGGVQLMLSPGLHISFGIAGMLSGDGKCKTFDKRANGYVRGEGCGAIFLKRLSDAEADGNHIYAVIKATAENHGGRVTTLTAPNSSAQAALLIEAYEKAHVDPATVGYIECHGTGTSLGDPIEIQALTKAFSELYKSRNKAPAETPHCGLSSVKTNIGHLETAAGIAGVLKVLLAIKHKQIPANIHFEEINPYINLKGTPFYVADKLTPWEAATSEDGTPMPRRAGVSSFGFGGANAHAVLEEYIPRQRQSVAQAGQHLIVLSAKTEDRLQAYVQSMQAHLGKEEIDLNDFAYTLQVGRDEMPERLALVVSSVDELKQKFGEILNGERPKDSYRNNIRNNGAKSQTADGADGESFLQALIEKKELSRLAELWVSGAKIDWRLLYDSGVPKRISAPTYPFARERCWVSKDRHYQAPTAAAHLHPLIHRNISTLEEQKFASRFSGEEFFLTDHVVGGQKILPGVTYLEMARAAGELSGKGAVRVIRNVTWERPLVVGSNGEEVEVSLVPVKNEVKFSVKTAGKESVIMHCTGKLAYALDTSEPEVLDIAGIKERCSEEVMSGRELYGPFLNGTGLKLGRSFQVVQTVYATESEALATLQMPEHLKKDANQFWLPPAMMDGSLHTAIGLRKKNGMDLPLSLPFSVGEVQIFHPLHDLYYGYATWGVENPNNNQNNLKVNFHLLDKSGRVLVRIKDFVFRAFHGPATKAVLQSLVPVWNTVRVEPRRFDLAEASRLLLLGDDPTPLNWVRKAYPNSELLRLVSTSSVETIEKALVDRSFDQLLWFAPDVTDESIIDEQERGVLALFRIIKALLRLGYATKPLKWTIVTVGTQRVTESDSIQPTHAGIVGLVGSLAKEYPNWDLRLLDLVSPASVSARECLSLPWDKQGNALAYRQGEWFQQELALMQTRPEAAPGYRQNGVYVVIGGAGGVGEVWSRFMIEHYRANIVWIGRREYNAAIEAKIKSLARLGPAPLYISADATNLDALEQACQTILKTHSAIHGVVHSAIVLQDQSISRMDESVFKASLSAKVDISVNMDRVFGKHELDFMLFFSSMISFVKSPGQSNYSAACTFKDSFALTLQKQRPYSVKIMNWGYWGSVGIVADDAHRKLMAQMGIGSIEPEEGMASLQALLGSDIPQMALIKTLNSEAAGFGLSEAMTFYPKAAGVGGPAGQPVNSASSRPVGPTLNTILTQVQRDLADRMPAPSIADLEAELPTVEMTELVTEILASSLKSLGLFNDAICKIADLALNKRPAPYYERWLSGSIRYLQAQNWLGDDLTFNREVRPLADLWPAWEARRSAWATNPNIALLEVCLKALPGILSGKQRATDVMFPNSSMQLVEGVYRGNILADYFNEMLSETLLSCLDHQLQEDKARGIRIIEIGAGTGGTTAKLLPLLRRFPIQEYCYTDISKAFLMYAEKHYRSQFPELTTAIFDVSKPVASQSIAAAHYDVAIAANVLHATPDIRETLRNAKAVLKNQGVLLVNEISTWSLFSHVTFGLLEGWWLHEDTAARLPGSPGLAPEKWRAILAEEGFESILFPAEKAHKLGQQIVAASSNGRVRQRIAKQVPQQQPSAGPAQNVRKETPSSRSAEVTEQMSNDYIRKIITDRLSEGLKLDAALIRSDAPFAEYGVDSIIGVDLVRTINETLQIELETTSLFEYTTVNQLAQYISTNWQAQIAGRLGPVQSTSQRPRGSDGGPAEREQREPGLKQRFLENDRIAKAGKETRVDRESDSGDIGVEPIAVIGMSGRFAKSESLDEFWQNLKEGKELVGKVSRWRTTDCVVSESAGRPYCSDGSFVESIDRFDPSFFRISPVEATYMDPQQRLFLEECWKALEDAGYAGKSVHEKQCGIYVGCVSSNYDSLFVEPPPEAFWGNSEAVIPARIAYYLNLHGPAIAVDTACSSSLVTIHLACQALRSRETEMALAGGVFLQATPGFYHGANRAGMLSPEGKCYSFDARANGFVPGEGVGVVVLKRLRDALQDGDYIHGVIAGSAVNQDGSSNGLISPNARAQERLERSVYDRFKINPETIQVVEAHGTGTILGDSIEYGAISRAFREYTDKKQFCALGTVKTNIGHAATAGGVAGVLKLLLSLKHRQIPPSLHFQKGNPAIDFESGPFYVNTELKEWRVEDDGRRRAAISSFGFGGTNAHLVIDEAPAIERTTIESPGYLVVLSARTAEQLKQQVLNLLALVKRTPDLSMNDLSFTLFAGRMHLYHRLSCVPRSQQELIHLLEQWLETGAASQVYIAEIPEGRTREQATLKRFGNYCIQECRNSTDAAEYLEYLATVADLYVQGYSLDFHALFAGDSRRIPLPTYPFAKERYWIDSSAPTRSRSTGAAIAALHPLLHTNTSTLQQQSYSSIFTGAESFLNGSPEVAWLEMARAAVEKAADIPQGSSVVELVDTVWGLPIIVGGNRQVTIAILPSDGEQIGYEIYSGEAGQEVIHCQGRASFSDQPVPARLDIEKLQRDKQALVRLSLPTVGDNGYFLHPSVMNGALQAGMRLIERFGSPVLPHALEHLRALAPCTEEMFAWVRPSSGALPEDKLIKVDIDVSDTNGNVCVEMRGLSFQADTAATSPGAQATWTSMTAVEKMELFLRQETALQLQKPMEDIPTDQNYFDLGLTSLGITHVIEKINRLLNENLSPSALFEYKNIQSLAAHLALTCPAKIDALAAVRRQDVQAHSAEQLHRGPANLTRLPRQKHLPVRLAMPPQTETSATATASEPEMSGDEILERVLWQEASLDDSYEKVAF